MNKVNFGLLITDNLINSKVFLTIDIDVRFYSEDRWPGFYYSSNKRWSDRLKGF